MALIRNGSHQLGGLNRIFGAVGAYGLRGNFDRNGAFRNFDSGQHAVSGVTNRNSIPQGARHPLAWKPPTKAGGLASHNEAEGAATATLSLASGRNVAGTSAGASTAAATLQLVVSMVASAAGVATVTGNVFAALGLAGSSAGSSTATAEKNAIGWLAGSSAGSSTASLTRYATGRLYGSISPFTELSPENLAANVWNAAAVTFNDAGTMGNKLNTASSGGVDLGALADAVRSELGVELSAIVEVWRRHGLDVAAPLTQTSSSITAGDIALTITGDPDTSVTVTREP